MPRTILQRPTLDDLFGPDLRERLELVRRQIDAAEAEESRFFAPDEGEAYAEAIEQYNAIAREINGLVEGTRNRFFMIWMMGEGIPLNGDGGGGCQEWPPSFKVSLFPSLRTWLIEHIWELEDSIRRGEDVFREALEELSGMLGRLAARVGLADDLSLSSIRDCLAALRRGAPMKAVASTAFGSHRELIGELLSPHVLAAGGGPGAFVLRI